MDMYSEHILEAYKNPMHEGRLEQPDFSAEDANPLCGDKVRFEMNLDDSGRVQDVGFVSAGCAISKASASLLADSLIGKTIPELEAITPEVIYDLLGVPLSPARVKCALLGQVVMRKSIVEKKYKLT